MKMEENVIGFNFPKNFIPFGFLYILVMVDDDGGGNPIQPNQRQRQRLRWA